MQSDKNNGKALGAANKGEIFMSYSALSIANYFLEKASEAGEFLSPMKLLKLVYFAHGWNLAIRNQPLLNEPVQAWRYGPVISSVYHQFKKFGNEAITELAPTPVQEIRHLREDANTKELLDKVWSVYSKYTAIQLSNLSHEKDSPWDKAWHEEDGKNCSNHIINNNLIKEYYLEQIKKNRASRIEHGNG